MIPNPEFLKQPRNFWAQVNLVSMTLGYSRGDEIRIYKIEEIVRCLQAHNLIADHLVDSAGKATEEGEGLTHYFQYRAMVLRKVV